MLDTLIRTGAQIVEPPEDNRFGWTNLCASRCEAALLSIVTEGALECAACVRQRRGSTIDDAEGTRDDAIAASITNVILHENSAGFSANNRPRRARFETAGFFAMFADIGQKYPTEGIFRLRCGYGGQVRLRVGQTHRSRDLISFLSILFEKHDVPPGRRAEVASVVVRISRPGEAVIRDLVPFLASDVTCFATDANTRVGEEAHLDVILHVGMFSLIGAFNSFADHIAPIYPGTRARDQPPLFPRAVRSPAVVRYAHSACHPAA